MCFSSIFRQIRWNTIICTCTFQFQSTKKWISLLLASLVKLSLHSIKNHTNKNIHVCVSRYKLHMHWHCHLYAQLSGRFNYSTIKFFLILSSLKKYIEGNISYCVLFIYIYIYIYIFIYIYIIIYAIIQLLPNNRFFDWQSDYTLYYVYKYIG